MFETNKNVYKKNRGFYIFTSLQTENIKPPLMYFYEQIKKYKWYIYLSYYIKIFEKKIDQDNNIII